MDRKVFEQIGKLSRLKMDESEFEKLSKDLNSVLGYIDNLDELDVEKDIIPWCYKRDVSDIFREDEIKESLTVDEALANAPERKDAFFKVPKVLPSVDTE